MNEQWWAMYSLASGLLSAIFRHKGLQRPVLLAALVRRFWTRTVSVWLCSVSRLGQRPIGATAF